MELHLLREVVFICLNKRLSNYDLFLGNVVRQKHLIVHYNVNHFCLNFGAPIYATGFKLEATTFNVDQNGTYSFQLQDIYLGLQSTSNDIISLAFYPSATTPSGSAGTTVTSGYNYVGSDYNTQTVTLNLLPSPTEPPNVVPQVTMYTTDSNCISVINQAIVANQNWQHNSKVLLTGVGYKGALNFNGTDQFILNPGTVCALSSP
jgi:hypothetical protein